MNTFASKLRMGHGRSIDLLDKMATYVRVVEAGSFSSAAKQIRISPAAVSRQVAVLEAGLRVTLLARSTRRMAVTPAGRRYYERCLRVLREVDDAQAVGRGEALDGSLHVTVPVTFGLARVVPHMRALMVKHPGLRIDLRLEDRLVDLALEGVDVAIRVGSTPADTTDVVAHRLFSFQRILVGSPTYLRRRGEPKTPEALAKHDALTYPVGNAPDGWTLTDGKREARVRVHDTFRSNALHAVRELAVDGAGIALLPDWLVADDVQRRTLRVVLSSWKTDSVAVHAMYRTAQRGASRIRALVDHLRDAYAPTRRPPSGL
jgi:DNA-binding transcriptional LysR family regulator